MAQECPTDLPMSDMDESGLVAFCEPFPLGWLK